MIVMCSDPLPPGADDDVADDDGGDDDAGDDDGDDDDDSDVCLGTLKRKASAPPALLPLKMMNNEG